MIAEPVLTWNLFLTALLVPLGLIVLGAVVKGFINRGFSQFQKGWDKYEEEKESNRKEKERDLVSWRDEVSKSLILLTTKLPILRTQDQCDEVHGDIHDMMNDHESRIVVLETKVGDLRRGS